VYIKVLFFKSALNHKPNGTIYNAVELLPIVRMTIGFYLVIQNAVQRGEESNVIQNAVQRSEESHF
jgi:predicted DNA-binding helix-hairpin-helix protein